MIRRFCLFALVGLSAQLAFAQPPIVFTLDEPNVNRLNPLVQDFENGAANFGRFDDEVFSDLDDNMNGTNGDSGDGVFTAPGGVGGSQQLQTVASLSETSQGVLWRAEAAFGSSLFGFTGNWLSTNVETLFATVQHDAPIDLQFDIRVATQSFAFGGTDNFPSVIADGFDPVAPNTLTELAVTVDPANFFAEAPAFGGFVDVLEDVTNVQIRAELPSSLGEVSQALFNVALFDPNITVPAGFNPGDIVDDFVILEDVPLVDENNVPIIAFGSQVTEDLALPVAGANVVFSTLTPITFGLDNFGITAVPEPATGALLAMAVLAGVIRHRR